MSNKNSQEKTAVLADDAFISDVSGSENDSETEKAAALKTEKHAAKERKSKKRKYNKRDEKIEVSIGDVLSNK